MQVIPCKSQKHSLESLDPMRSIRTLHTQQQQNREKPVQSDEVSRGPNNRPPQEHNLITFTPPLPRNTGRQGEPKKHRTPRKRKQRSDWQLNQRQFEQNKSQEVSHISQEGQVDILNTEEPSMSYLQLPVKKTQEDNRKCSRCGEIGHLKRYCQVNT